MNNSNSYWDQTLNEFQQSLCGCDCIKTENENENNQGINQNQEIDELFTYKLAEKNIDCKIF